MTLGGAGDRIRLLRRWNAAGNATGNATATVAAPKQTTKDTCPSCPVCFNCNLASDHCLQFAECESSSGTCQCPPGFGGSNCSVGLCQSLGADHRRPKADGAAECTCDAGWTGINCNVCAANPACDALVPPSANATCYRGADAIHANHAACNVTNAGFVPFLRQINVHTPPEITLSCDATRNECTFQLWIDHRESFYCRLQSCEQATGRNAAGQLATAYTCATMRCECVPEELLCRSHELDLSEFFGDAEEGPRGPGKLTCRELTPGNHTCSFNEPGLDAFLQLMIGEDRIEMQCAFGECVAAAQLPDHGLPGGDGAPPASGAGLATAAAVLVGSLLLAGALFALVAQLQRAASRRQRRETLAWYQQHGIAVPDSADLAASWAPDHETRTKVMMAGHVPVTLMFKDMRYSVPLRDSGDGPWWARLGRALFHRAVPHSPEEPTERDPLLAEATSPQDPLVVLESVLGAVYPGQVLAIMGGSGAGKTTFLELLARRNKKGTVSGTVLVNGKQVSDADYRRIVGYVDQEDCLLPTLTVYETILYSALLRLPGSMPLRAKKSRVQEAMHELGIAHISDRRIGREGQRGISGGEKRRVSIACELVTNPSVLFLDEPTSGLDAFNAYNVVESLVALANDFQRTIVLTIHQPRSNIYNLFDQLVLLAHGQVVYSGPAQAPAIEHFGRLGFHCPPGFNLADYLVDLTMHQARDDAVEHGEVGDSGDSGAARSPAPSPVRSTASSPSDLGGSVPSIRRRKTVREQQEEQLFTPTSPSAALASTGTSSASLLRAPAQERHLARLVRGFQRSPSYAQLQRAIADAQSTATQIESANRQAIAGEMDRLGPAADALGMSGGRRSLSRQASALLQRLAPGLYATDPRAPAQQLGASGANTWTQLQILSQRTLKNLVRNPALLQAHLALAVGTGLLCGALFWRVGNDIAGFQNRLGFFFFACCLFAFECLSSVHAFAGERILFVRERANGYYAPASYFATKVLFDILPLRVVPPLLYGAIAYHMVGLRADSLVYVAKFLAMLVGLNVASASVCLCIGILLREPSVASLVSSIVMLFEMLFGGLLLNSGALPAYLVWLQRLSFFHSALEGLLINELVGLKLYEHKLGLSVEVPAALVLDAFGFAHTQATFLWDALQLVGIIVFSLLFGLFWLQVFVREQR